MYSFSMSHDNFRALAEIADDIHEVVIKSGVKNKPIVASEVASRIHKAVDKFVSDHAERILYDHAEINSRNLPPLTNVEYDIADMLIIIFDAAKDFGVDIAYAVETKYEYDKQKL